MWQWGGVEMRRCGGVRVRVRRRGAVVVWACGSMVGGVLVWRCGGVGWWRGCVGVWSVEVGVVVVVRACGAWWCGCVVV